MNFTKAEIAQYAQAEASRRGLVQCVNKTVCAVLVTNEGNAYFGFNFVANQPVWCPRRGMARGAGYELCRTVCGGGLHAEIDALQQFDAHEQKGTHGRMFVFSVNHICDACRAALSERTEISFKLIKGE